jgi:hypothetical protein
MTLKKAIFKIPLDILAFLLRQSKDAVYYLVNEGLRDDIKTAVDVAYAHEHIENACFLARKYENTGGGVICKKN